MAGMDIVPFVPEHAGMIELRPLDAKTLAGLDPQGRKALGESLAERGTAFTGLWQGRVAACAGVALLWPGTGEAWALTSPLVPRLALSFHRAVTRFLPRIQDEMKLARIQATVREDNAPGQRWLERLGFGLETPHPMRAYVGGENYYLYARVRT